MPSDIAPLPTPTTEPPRKKVVVTPPTIADVTIEEEIGRGGMGVVYRGRQTYIDRRVAVKLLLVDKNAPDAADYVRRFQREAKILAGLSHPHIVACYQAGITADGNCFLVMEYIDGRNLWDWIKLNGHLTEHDALEIVRDIARALEHANAQGIIHRDVKPENILLQRRDHAKPEDKFPFVAKLVDLGLARPQRTGGESQLTMQGVVMGTPATMAPEQFEDPDGVDFRADIYGLGCVLFHALTGKPAFQGTTLAQIVTNKITGAVPDPLALRGGLGRGVADLASAMLAKKKEDRPQSYSALVERCEALLSGVSTPATAVGGRGALIGFAVAAALVVGVALAWPKAGASSPTAPSVPADGLTAPVEKPPAAPPTPLVVVVPTVVMPPPAPPVVEPWRTVKLSPKAVVFAAAEPLFNNEDMKKTLDGWLTVAGWGPEENGHGIIGANGKDTSRITRPLQPAPWKIEGIISSAAGEGAAAFREAAICVQLTDGSEIQVGVKNLGAAFYLALADSGDKSKVTVPRPLPAKANEWRFSITAYPNTLTGSVGEVDINPLPLRSPPAALSLSVSKGAVGFRELTIAYAKP